MTGAGKPEPGPSREPRCANCGTDGMLLDRGCVNKHRICRVCWRLHPMEATACPVCDSLMQEGDGYAE